MWASCNFLLKSDAGDEQLGLCWETGFLEIMSISVS